MTSYYDYRRILVVENYSESYSHHAILNVKTTKTDTSISYSGSSF